MLRFSLIFFSAFNRCLGGNFNLSEVIANFVDAYPVKLWESRGFFTENYLRKINPHWLNFPPQSFISHYILAVLYVFIMIIGLTGNSLVIYLFIKFKSLRTPANTLVVNLAVSDLLMMSMLPLFIYNSLLMGPALGDYVCRYYGFLGGLSGTCSICTLSAISLDRYYVVKFPLNRRFTNLRSKICVLVSWIYAVTFSAIPLLNLGLGDYTPEGFLTSCSYDYLTKEKPAKIFILVFFFAAWTVPFLLITFTYANILQVVLQSRNISKKSLENRESVRHMKAEEKKRQELRLTLVVFMVIMMWFVAWTPYAAVSLLGIAGQEDLISPLTSMIPALFAKTASCFDPYVYALTHPRFKAELLVLFGKKKKQDTMKMWTTQSHRTTKRCGSEVTDNEETENEEICSGVKVPNQSGCVEVLEEDFRRKSGKCKKSWWFKPSFSNRSSSMRGLARTWTARKRSTEETNENEFN